MKYLILTLALVLSGCATTPSEYSQGCQDGVTTFIESITRKAATDEDLKQNIRQGCDTMDAARNQKSHDSRADLPRGRSER